jgi:cysteinyl-tRNA synthetase
MKRPPLVIYNSMNQKKVPFEPLSPGKVSMYVCGVTVYDHSHLGHARAAVTFDIMYRYLTYLGYAVNYVRNFTDVDDKIIKKSQETGETCEAVSQKYIDSYWEDMDVLRCARPTHEPRAMQHIEDMIALIKKLMDQGLAYAAEGDVFYSVKKFNGYGKLSHKIIADLESGARIEVDEKKQDPLDFALWKGSKLGEPAWESPWGQGRPGWHIECSAMSMKYLGHSFDIHGGGRDLIFPHHENEIAQSEGATGEPFAKYWLHNGFVSIDDEKMSKSLGNFLTVKDIVQQFPPETVRYFLLTNHYSSPIDFSEQRMKEAQGALTRFYEGLARLQEFEADDHDEAKNHELNGLLGRAEEAMCDDFNTAKVIGILFDWVRELNKYLDELNGGKKSISKSLKDSLMRQVEEIGDFLQVFQANPQEFLKTHHDKAVESLSMNPADIEAKLKDRAEARKNKDWVAADAIRDELTAHGIEFKDNPDGTTSWSVKSVS